MARASLRRHGGVEQHASTLELFYDLVFVFAITQVSHLLLHRLTWEGAGRILTWFVAAGVLWIAGALTAGLTRTLLWLAALALDYGAPLVTFWLPGRPALSPESWEVGTEHFAERFQLFIIVALGETIVITGATTAQLKLTTARVAAFALAFLTTAALWWLYFNLVATTAERQLAKAKDRTLLARDASTYLHVVIVAGILLTAVGDELVIAHPTQDLQHAELVAVVCGPALYLLAHVALRLRMTGTVSERRLAGALACLPIGAIGTFAPALVVAALLFGVLIAVIVGDQVSADRRQTRNEPTPPARLETAG